MYRLVAAGSNACGQLGSGNIEDTHRFVPTFREVGGQSGCKDSFEDSKPGLSEKNNHFPPSGYRIYDLSAGANHTLALLQPTSSAVAEQTTDRSNLQIWVCGDDWQGQLGGSVLITPACTFRRLELSQVLRTLDNDETAEKLLEELSTREGGGERWTPTGICAGWETSYIILSDRMESGDDVLIGLGSKADFGELGELCENDGLSAARKIEMGGLLQNLYQQGLPQHDKPNRMRIREVRTGLRHILVHIDFEDGRNVISGWGARRHGQLGAVPQVAGLALHPNVRAAQGSLQRKTASPAYTATPQAVSVWQSGDEELQSLAAGRDHTAVLTKARTSTEKRSEKLLLLGSNKHGQISDQLGPTAQGNRCRQVACTWNGTYLLLDQDKVLCSGADAKGQLGNGETTAKSLGPTTVDLSAALGQREENGGHSTHGRITKLACGSEHIVALVERFSSNGRAADAVERAPMKTELWAWGWNEHGNLGLGDTEDRGRPVKIFPVARELAHDSGPKTSDEAIDNTEQAVDVWAGCGTTFLQLMSR